MAKKEFSTDFPQKTGNTPLNFRVLVEDPATGTEYWATTEQVQAILAAEVSLKLPSSAIADLTRTNNMGKVLSDVTYSLPWVGGFTVDTIYKNEDGKYVKIKKTSHGLQNNDVVEFNPNGGVLPGGIEAFNSGLIGQYYNVINATANSFSLTENPGSVYEKPLSTVGSGAWQIRKSAQGFMVDLPLFAADSNAIKVVLHVNYGFKANAENSTYIAIPGVELIVGTDNTSYIFPNQNFGQKISGSQANIHITKYNINRYMLNYIWNQFSRSKIGVLSNSVKTEIMQVFTSADLNSIYIGSNNDSILLIRSIRAIIIQQ